MRALGFEGQVISVYHIVSLDVVHEVRQEGVRTGRYPGTSETNRGMRLAHRVRILEMVLGEDHTRILVSFLPAGWEVAGDLRARADGACYASSRAEERSVVLRS